jgi:hypothetical protein
MAHALTGDRLSVWKDRVARQEASGLSVTKFCQQEQISDTNFYYWRRKLKGPARGRKSAARRRSDRSAGSHQTAERSFFQLAVPQPQGSAWVEITSANGTLIRLPQQNLAALELTLATLSGAGQLAR